MVDQWFGIDTAEIRSYINFIKGYKYSFYCKFIKIMVEISQAQKDVFMRLFQGRQDIYATKMGKE